VTRARQAGTTIANPKAYLITAVTRLGINYLSSARVRRETYVGDWLPEPVVVPADGPGPAEHAELAAAKRRPSDGAARARERRRVTAHGHAAVQARSR
jgi:DNA-directed RNA polymerase specialized sigma24 family protein